MSRVCLEKKSFITQLRTETGDRRTHLSFRAILLFNSTETAVSAHKFAHTYCAYIEGLNKKRNYLSL